LAKNIKKWSNSGILGHFPPQNSIDVVHNLFLCFMRQQNAVELSGFSPELLNPEL